MHPCRAGQAGLQPSLWKKTGRLRCPLTWCFTRPNCSLPLPHAARPRSSPLASGKRSRSKQAKEGQAGRRHRNAPDAESQRNPDPSHTPPAGLPPLPPPRGNGSHCPRDGRFGCSDSNVWCATTQADTNPMSPLCFTAAATTFDGCMSRIKEVRIDHYFPHCLGPPTAAHCALSRLFQHGLAVSVPVPTLGPRGWPVVLPQTAQPHLGLPAR